MGGADGWRPFGESAVAVGRQLNLKQDFFFPLFGKQLQPTPGVRFSIITYWCLLNKYFPS